MVPPPPPLQACTLGTPSPLGLPATSGGPAFSMSPLLHSNLKHLSLQLFCFPSSLISFFCLNSSSFSSSSSSFGSLSPRCPATAVRVHHHGGAGERGEPGKECVGESQAFTLHLAPPPCFPYLLPSLLTSACHARCTQPHTSPAPR